MPKTYENMIREMGNTIPETKETVLAADGAQSGFSKFLLGDNEKKAAKIEERKADAAFTAALAQMASQLAVEETGRKASAMNTKVVVIGGVAVIGVIGLFIYLLRKRAA